MKTILYDNYDCRFDEAEQELLAMYGEQPTDDQVWDYINDNDRMNWEDMLAVVRDYEKAHGNPYWLAVGTSGQWYGKCRGGIVCESFEELLQKIGRDCDYFHIEIDQYGRLNVNCTHHDGTNKVTVKALTEKGTDLWNTYLNNWCCYYHHENPKRYKNEYDEYTYEQMHEVLFNSKTYSKNYGRVA